MPRRDSSSLAWLAALGLAMAGTLAVAGYAGFHFIRGLSTQAREALRPYPPPTTAPRRPETPAPARATPVAPPTRATPPAAARPAAAGLGAPPFTAEDGRRSADDAYRDLWVALGRRDGAAASKYVPAAKLTTLKSESEVVSHFLGLPVSQVKLAKSTTSGDKAVLFAKTSSSAFTDDKGRPAPVDVVVRMARENGYWKVQSQMWLVSTPPEQEQREAMAWLKAAPARPGDTRQAAIAKLAALGLKHDAESFQSAVARADAEQVRLFLQAGMSARTRLSDGASLLSLALLGIQGDDPAKQNVAIALIQAGADVEERTPTGMTALMQAAFNCKPRVVDALLQARARVDAKDNDGRTVITYARLLGCSKLEPRLRAAGAR